MGHLLNGPKARAFFALLGDDTSDSLDSINEMIDAHTAHQDKAFYQAAARAARHAATSNDAVRLLSQGRDDEARKRIGMQP